MPVVGALTEYEFPRHPGGVTAVVQRYTAGADDAHGNPVGSWVDYAILHGCAFDPGSTSEPRIAGQDRVIVEPALYAAYDSPVESLDRIIVEALVFEVEGVARRWQNPMSGRKLGCVITLRHVDG
jgi:head-tail adaptor